MTERTENTENIKPIIVDGSGYDLDISDVGTFSELIRKVEIKLVPEGRVITHIILNGDPITEEQETLFAGFNLENVEKLEITTEEPVKLALKSLDDTLDYLPHLASSVESVAQKLRSGDYAAGLENLQESLELIKNFNLLIDGIRQVLMIDFHQIKLENDEGGNFASLNTRLSQVAAQILEATKNEDWSELADQLDYELSPLLYRYLGAIPFVIQEVHKSRDEVN